VKQDNGKKCSLTIVCLFLPDTSPLLEGAIICGSQRSERIAGQSFYVSEKNAADILEEQKDEIWLFPSAQAGPRVPDADRILGKYIAGILDPDRADKYLSALLRHCGAGFGHHTGDAAQLPNSDGRTGQTCRQDPHNRPPRNYPDRRSQAGNLLCLRRFCGGKRDMRLER
jgi:hypothetical protein